MNQLFVLFLGNIIAALCGPLLHITESWYSAAKVTAIVAGFGAVFFRRYRFGFALMGIVMWSLIHNPKQWALGNYGTAIDSNGCGFITDDLLIAVHGSGEIVRARGRGLMGDQVERSIAPMMKEPLAIINNPTLHMSYTCHFAGKLRSHLLGFLSEWPPGRREWLQSFILGADMHLDQVTLSALRRLGLLHIVVLSGSHIAVLAMFVLLGFRFLPLLGFSLRVVTMRTWPLIWSITAVICVLGVVIFAFTVGAPQSVQRAMVLFLVFQASDLLWIRKPIGEVLLWVWLVQAVLFPVHILSLSMFLSWSGSLILSGVLKSHFRKSWFELLREKIFIQTLFGLGSLLVFGYLGLGSLLANLLFGPIFSFALPVNFVLLFGAPHAGITKEFVALQMSILAYVRRMDVWQLDHPWMMMSFGKWFHDRPTLFTVGQILFLLLLMVRVYVRTKQRRRDSL